MVFEYDGRSSFARKIMNLRSAIIPLELLRPSLVLLAAGMSGIVYAEPNLLLWDTGSTLGAEVRSEEKQQWRRVPTDLFKLEANPLKSSSDPGYYGREYSFAGDMVVDARQYTMVFSSTTGSVSLFSHESPGRTPSTGSSFGEKIAEITPLGMEKPRIQKVSVIRNSGDEIAAEVFFGGEGAPETQIYFEFGRTEVIEMKPGKGLKGVSLHGPVAYAVVPSFVGDDLLFGPVEDSESGVVALPAENILVALLEGEARQLVFTWPKGGQHVQLGLGGEKEGKRAIASIDIQTEGQALFLTPQSTPGIWHREKLSARYLEKEVASEWRRPFTARWQTQLNEAGVNTRFVFHDEPVEIWRGVPGSYQYPVWFEGDMARYHLSKKVAAKGESIVYFIEGSGTPASMLTPVDILRSTLGRSEADPIIDLPGRKLRTHHRRGGTGVRRACTCGCTEAIEAIFEAGEEATRKEEIRDEIGDMIYFVQCHVQRIAVYQKFSGELEKHLKARAESSPELKNYVDAVISTLQQIPQEYEVQKENMRNLDYARELEASTMQLTVTKDAGNLEKYRELLKAWRAMGGAQDYVLAQCHALTRKFFQEASYAAGNRPKAVDLALEIRARCRQVLREADGYEIWPDY